MKRLIIIGAGGLGREVAGLADMDEKRGREWEIAGFLDNRPGILEGKNCPFPLLGSPDDYHPQDNDLFVTGIMNAVEREKYCKMILDRGGQFTNIVHRNSSVSFGTSFGIGNVIGLWAALSTNVKIGNFCIINTLASIGHDAILEDYASIHNRALISGGTRIGRGAEIGANATVLPKAIVEPYARLGAGSVLIGKAPSNRLMMGVPAKPMDLPGA
jgi:sugar O-acyltransferase (sialic acid O-acetyltransferase NeuD family)